MIYEPRVERLPELKETAAALVELLEKPEPTLLSWWNNLAQAGKRLQLAMVGAGIMQPVREPAAVCTCGDTLGDVDPRCPAHFPSRAYGR